MKTYTVLKNQSLVDVAIQLYGNVDALPELLLLNRETLGHGSGDLALAEAIEQVNYANEYDLGIAIPAGTLLVYDETSVLRNSYVLQQRGSEPLCTATENEVLLELPLPPPLPAYVYHPDTLVFLEDRIGDVPGGDWHDYMSVDESIMLDRFVRDLHGEANTGYATEDIWGKLVGMYPFMGSDAQVHGINLSGPLRMTWFGGVTHAANAAGMDGTSGYGNTSFIDGTDTNQFNVCLGIVVSNYQHQPAIPYTYPNQYMGAIALGNAMHIRNFNGRYEAMVTAGSGPFASAIGHQPNEYLHMEGSTASQSLYLGATNDLIATKPSAGGTSSGADIYVGKTAAGHGVQADINLAYIGRSLSDSERRSLMNSVNFFLYSKGVRASFAAIV